MAAALDVVLGWMVEARIPYSSPAQRPPPKEVTLARRWWTCSIGALLTTQKRNRDATVMEYKVRFLADDRLSGYYTNGRRELWRDLAMERNDLVSHLYDRMEEAAVAAHRGDMRVVRAILEERDESTEELDDESEEEED